MKKTNLIIISLLLLCVIMFNTVGCSSMSSANLMRSIKPNKVSPADDLFDANGNATDFAVRLFKAANEGGKNTLISPLSVMCALAMTVNGADGETRKQMEDMFGMSAEELNLYIYSYMSSLPQEKKYKLNLANSIWFTDNENFTVNEKFLQINADYYGADIYKVPFNKGTLKDVNNWVEKKTDKMIPKILDELSENAIMYLINALAFEAEWSDIYKKDQVSNGIFTKEDGTQQDAVFMYSTEGKYLEDKDATGFIKYYSGKKYAFVALLPDENVSLSEYISSLDGDSLYKLLSEAENKSVRTAIPKFETEYSTELSAVLKSMGMENAFNGATADFSKLGNTAGDNLFISRVIHKTFIQVGEKGTKAGAATAVEIKCTSIDRPDDQKQVYLDRPFVYMLIDCENNVPFFIGSMTDIKK